MVNIRTKGQSGEREICDALNAVYAEVCEELHIELNEKLLAQRNQNQSAVGGDDISYTCGMSIEVKRHEKPAVNTWWAQCLKSAVDQNKTPVLLYRANRQKWRCVTFGTPYRLFDSEDQVWARVEMSFEDFLKWFKAHAIRYIQINGSPR